MNKMIIYRLAKLLLMALVCAGGPQVPIGPVTETPTILTKKIRDCRPYCGNSIGIKMRDIRSQFPGVLRTKKELESLVGSILGKSSRIKSILPEEEQRAPAPPSIPISLGVQPGTDRGQPGHHVGQPGIPEGQHGIPGGYPGIPGGFPGILGIPGGYPKGRVKCEDDEILVMSDCCHSCVKPYSNMSMSLTGGAYPIQLDDTPQFIPTARCLKESKCDRCVVDDIVVSVLVTNVHPRDWSPELSIDVWFTLIPVPGICKCQFNGH